MKSIGQLSRIRLELARTDGFPEGSARHGYEFIAPLTKDAHLDPATWQGMKELCTVTRFWGDEPEERGRLRHVGRGWRFDYRDKDEEDDEPLFKLDRHVIAPGNYVSVTEHDHVQRPFRVVAVTPVGKSS